MMLNPIRIVVADDHTLFRSGLVELLRTVNDFEVEGEAGTGDEAITLARELKPDLVIVDVAMPGPGPSETVATIRSLSPMTQVLVVTTFDEPRLIHDLIRAGAAGYLLKSSDRAELATAVRAAARAKESVIVIVSRQALLGLAGVTPAANELLSPREAEVLDLLAQAKSNHDIGCALHISEATVKRHLTNIYVKLGASTRAEALHHARRQGLA